MSESKPGPLRRRASGSHRGSRSNVTMIEVTDKRHATRRAKIAFWAVGVTAAMCAAVIASGITNIVFAVFIGVLTGLALGGLFGAVIFCWPAMRVAWHWTAEIGLLALVLTGYIALIQAVAWWAALSILALALVGPFGLPGARRLLTPWIWCGIVRHRLRLYFTAFIASQHHGVAPLILIARPTPAGERVWIWLRPGLAKADIEARLDKLAVGCWASECRVTGASRRCSALLRLDIARRNPLSELVGSPLPDLVPAYADSAIPVSPALAPTGLDLPDTPETMPANPAEKRRLPALPATPATPEPVLADILTTSRDVDDLNDWI